VNWARHTFFGAHLEEVRRVPVAHLFLKLLDLFFFLLIGFVFWLTSLHDRPDFERKDKAVREARKAEAHSS